jgi:hypothetical protein
MQIQKYRATEKAAQSRTQSHIMHEERLTCLVPFYFLDSFFSKIMEESFWHNIWQFLLNQLILLAIASAFPWSKYLIVRQ